MKAEKLPLRGQLIYASGMLGWSVITSSVAVMLVYFYQPPAESGLQNLIPKIGVLGVVNAMAMIMMSTRIWDAVIDPVIAYISDKSTHRLGRRVVFMRYALIPILITGILLFIPLTKVESISNIWWLAGIQIVFNLVVSLYIIPYNAMLPELGHSSVEKLRISTYQSVGFVLGWIIAAAGPGVFEYFRDVMHYEPLRAIQFAMWINFSIAVLFMSLPALFLNEKKYCSGNPPNESLRKNLMPVLRNRNFFLYLVSDFTYFISLTIMGTGALYYVQVLLKLPESFGTIMILIMVSLSFLCYPLVNWLAQKVSKKILVLISLYSVSFVFMYVFYMGTLPFENKTEAYLLSIIMAFPLAFLGILPPVILAEITHLDAYKTHKNKEATYFAIRSLFIQFGQTLGIAVFTILIGLDPQKSTGKWIADMFPNIPANELGIRLSGIFGFVLCFLAATIFIFFNNKKLQKDILEMEIATGEDVNKDGVIGK